MADRSSSKPEPQRPANADAGAPLRSILIPVDLTPGFEKIAEQVALLPLAEDVRVTLLHVAPRELRKDERRRAEEDARRALTATAARLVASLPARATVTPLVARGRAAAEITRHARAARAELIVMGRGRGRMRDSFVGSTAERVVRQGLLPVLVVRLRARPYRRPLVAVDFDAAALDALTFTLRLVPPPRPPFTVLHVYDAPFERSTYPSLSPEEVQRHREIYRERALEELSRLLAAVVAKTRGAEGEPDLSSKLLVRYGSPRTVIRRMANKLDADLLAVGTHAYPAMKQMLLGTVAGDVLREVRCDVLVVPARSA